MPQGTVLGPILFLVFINDLPESVRNSLVRLFADDAAVYRQIDSVDDARQLQEDLDSLTAWEAKWQMQFHPSKCKVLHITRNTNRITFTYNLRGENLSAVQEEKYLGVKLDDRLSWRPHIEATVGKGRQKLGFLRRNLKINSVAIKTRSYQTLVRPNLEYCCTAWSPHQKGQIEQLESIQRKAARFVFNKYGWRQSPTAMLKRLGWESLENRRKKFRIALTYKILNGHVAIPPDKYFTRNEKSTRGCAHSKKLQERGSKCDYLNATFFRASPSLWNGLPPKIAEAPSIMACKANLAKYALPLHAPPPGGL